MKETILCQIPGDGCTCTRSLQKIMDEYKAISPDIADSIQCMIDKEVAHQKNMARLRERHDRFMDRMRYVYLITGIVGVVGCLAAALYKGQTEMAMLLSGAVGFLLGVGIADITSSDSIHIRRDIRTAVSKLRVSALNAMKRSSAASPQTSSLMFSQ